MSIMYNGSFCLTDILAKAKAGHSAFSKADNGKIYFNVITWLNDEADKYGNKMSHQLNSTKEKREQELNANGGKIPYIGNSKEFEKKENKPLSQSDLGTIPDAEDDLPF